MANLKPTDSKSGTEKRQRSDSVLGSRMDELHDYRKLRSTKNSKWQKLRNVIDKEHTQLMMIEVPKNVSVIGVLEDFVVQY